MTKQVLDFLFRLKKVEKDGGFFSEMVVREGKREVTELLSYLSALLLPSHGI